jgi:pyruvate/2-oxoglutarate dehydrogenase complex dihydrolipoamide acyltransferase (E2) component
MQTNAVLETPRERPLDDRVPQERNRRGYRVLPFTVARRMIAATASVGRAQNNIQALIEVDVTKPRRLILEHRRQSGEKLSLTAYVIACLGRALSENPILTAFRKGGKLIILDDITVGVLVERRVNGETMPQLLGIQAVQRKPYRAIHDEIRAAQASTEDHYESFSGMTWFRFIPSFLLPVFLRLASQSIRLREQNGTVAVTAVGMFGNQNQAAWGIPLSAGATVGVTVGSIVERPAVVDGGLESREHLCLTVSFNHDIVDGAPAARFLQSFSEQLESGKILRKEVIGCSMDQRKEEGV